VIDFAIESRIARLLLQRPAASNAFTGEMLSQLLAALTRAASEADILAISAAGNDFSLGRDRQDAKAGPPPFEAFKLITDVNAALGSFPGIAVCSVQGRAFGFGVGIVMRSDIAIAAADARFMLDEVKLGIPPMFIMEQILEHLPAKRALDFILTGREFGADEALQIGLVSRVVGPDDLDGTVGEFVATLRSRDRRVVLACKRYLRAVGKMPPEVRSAYALVEQTQFAMGHSE
jgi:enoyl-CoA hydratase/carnithine racemase